jgi:thiol-disulfide isomerase/thioredoxin
VCAVAVPAGRADEARFVPWKDVKTPPLALRDLAGRQQALADYRGKVVLVNFWATWCEPCREEMPSMQRLKERFAGEPFAVLAVNNGEVNTRASEFLKRSSLDLTVLLDPSQDASRAWRVRVLPASFLIGPDGRARYAVIGEIDWMSRAAVETVRRLLP